MCGKKKLILMLRVKVFGILPKSAWVCASQSHNVLRETVCVCVCVVVIDSHGQWR